MKIFTKKGLMQKIIISILIVFMVSAVIMPTVSRAEDFGGTLFGPIRDFLTALGDIGMWVANKAAGNGGSSTIAEYDYSLNGLEKQGLIMYGFHEYSFPNFKVTPEKIFGNKVPLLDINIMNPSPNSIAGDLQGIIGGWYKTFRNIAIVGLLSVLVYISIRILLSSVAADKAKYKAMLKDWVVAFCLLFFMHYIMSFSITIIENITNSIYNSTTSQLTVSDAVHGEDNEYDYLDTLGLDGTENIGLTEFIRIKLELVNDGAEEFGYTVIYLVLVIYTIMFLIIYLKRLVYIIFLTMLAPLVALTYPLDKMKDGSAQGFNIWLKEYMFNLLLQPLHLLLFYVLISSAIELSAEYIVYPLVVLGFMLPAEKVLRKLFGFEKSTTASSLFSGAMGGAAVMQGINWLSHKAKGMSKGGSSSPKGGSIREDGVQDKFKGGKDFEVNDMFDKDENARQTVSYENNSGIDSSFFDDKNDRTSNNIPKWEDTNAELSNTDLSDSVDYSGFDFSDVKYDDANLAADNKVTAEIENNNENIRTVDTPEEQLDSVENPGEEVSDKELERQRKRDGRRAFLNEFGINEESMKKLGKNAIKGAVGTVGAATLGTVGIAAGLASDDFKNVAGYGIAAGAVGAGVGSGLTGKVMDDSKKFKAAKDAYTRAVEGKKKYQEMVNEKLNKEHMKDKKVQAMYREAFDRDWKKAMEASLEYRNKTGVTDNETIIKTMKEMDKKGYSYTDRRGLAVAKLASNVQNRKDLKYRMQDLAKAGVKAQQIKEVEEMTENVKGYKI